ncbi:MAG: L,D-transpeptidase family protein [Anaerolineales bacterium]
MKPDPDIFRRALLNSQQAIQRGDRLAAHDWAEKAALLGPEAEEPWLILAAISEPRDSVRYLEQALKINPHSQRARKGMHWAVERLRHTQPENQERYNTSQPVSGLNSLAEPDIQPHAQKTPPPDEARSAASANRHSAKSLARVRWSFLALFLVAVCITAVWAFWPGNADPVLAFLHVPRSLPAISGILASMDTPTAIPSATLSFTPTAISTTLAAPSAPVIPAALAMIPTLTPLSVPTITSTKPPTPTETVLPTKTPWPTSTGIVWPTSTLKPRATLSTGGVRWIDVNLSKQMLYAYEGNTVVASFLVSTGVPAFPTVTGQYHIYVKYLYTLMQGDNYYLPNVPYTMYFYKGYGIHGTYWHHNFGHPMSHGCVNMYTPDAEWMYYWASIGTLVNIHY